MVQAKVFLVFCLPMVVTSEEILVATKDNMAAPFDGYLVDLVKNIGRLANFTPVYQKIPNYPQSLVDVNYSMLAADLTIFQSRLDGMDFSLPYMKAGLVITFKKPSLQGNIFSFLCPLSAQTWLLLLSCFTLVCLLLYLTSQILEDPAPGFLDCLWLVAASLFGQATDFLPKYLTIRASLAPCLLPLLLKSPKSP